MSEWTHAHFCPRHCVPESVVDALREENARLTRERDEWEMRADFARMADEEYAALRARVEELEAQIDAALATTWTPDDEGGWGTEEDTLHPDRASALAALVPYWREWGDEAWDKAGRAEAALLSGGSQEPRPDTDEDTWLASLDEWDRKDAEEALSMIRCPYYEGTGICTSGCRTEPACLTGSPSEGWEGVLERLGRPDTKETKT